LSDQLFARTADGVELVELGIDAVPDEPAFAGEGRRAACLLVSGAKAGVTEATT